MDEDGWKAVKPFAREQKFNYPIVLGDETTAARFGAADSLPVTVLLDRQGNVIDTHVGVIDREVWERRIRGLLGLANP